MEFWGVEVKHGVPLHIDPGEDMLVHISQAALGEMRNNESEPIRLYLTVGDQKLVIGTLSHDQFPQLATEIVLERNFALSHSWKNGSVFFSGYKVDASDPEADMSDDELAVATDKGVKQVNFQLPNEDVKAKQDDDDDVSESSDDVSSEEDSGDEEEKKVTAEADSDEDDEDDSSDSDEDDSSDSDEDDSSEEDTPKKPEEPKKRAAEATSSKNSTSNKKAKFVTPQKTETKKPHVHVATPHPSKQAGKNSAGSSNGQAPKQQQTPKSAAAFGCNSCNRIFTSEMGLQSHTKAKHSAAA